MPAAPTSVPPAGPVRAGSRRACRAVLRLAWFLAASWAAVASDDPPPERVDEAAAVTDDEATVETDVAEAAEAADDAAESEASEASEASGESEESGGLDPNAIVLDLEDGFGQRWRVAGDGGIHGSAGGVEGGLRLSVGGDAFVPESIEEDPFAAEVVVRGRAGGCVVERGVRIDVDRGGVLFVDTVEVPGDGEEPVVLDCALVSGLSGVLEGVVADGGGDFGRSGLPDGVSGLSAVARQPGAVPVFHWVVAGRGGRVGEGASAARPEVEVTEGRELMVRHRVEAVPGERVSLVHWAFQRPAGREAGEAGGYARVFDPFVRRGHLIAFSAPAGAALGRVVNFAPEELSDEGFVAPEAGALVVVRELERRLGVRRLDQDILWVSGEAQLAGRAEGSAVRLSGARGDLTFAFEEVAAIEGGGGRGRQHRLMLRDGRVLVGRIAMDRLVIAGERGWGLEPSIDQIEWMLFRLDARDGVPPAGVGAWVALHSGEVLPLVGGGPGDVLPLQTAWGAVDLPMEAIASVRYLKEPSPRYRVRLVDGTRWTGFLGDRELAVRLSAGDAESLPVALPSIAALWRAGTAPVAPVEAVDDLVEVLAFDEIEPPLPGDRTFCLLMGGNVLAGELADERIHVVTGTAVTELAPGEILEIARDASDLDELNPLFEIRLRGGDGLRGRLRAAFVTIETGRRLWTVPVQHFIGMRRPPES